VTAAVTALRRAGRGKVAVELDGSPWRVLPLEAVLASGVTVGTPLDRPRARRLRAELRRVEARDVALSALARRDHTAAMLRGRLDAVGIAPVDRDAALAALERTGLVDDVRVARTRAAALAARGAGNGMIRDDLERRGLPGEVVDDAIASLEPELERARRLVRPAGGDRRDARRLVARGFDEDVVAAMIAPCAETELG